MIISISIPILQFVGSFISVFFKGFQHQNVIGGKYKSAFFVAYIMAAMEVIIIVLIAKTGYASIIPVGTGAALGITSSMAMYRYIHKKRAS